MSIQHIFFLYTESCNNGRDRQNDKPARETGVGDLSSGSAMLGGQTKIRSTAVADALYLPLSSFKTSHEVMQDPSEEGPQNKNSDPSLTGLAGSLTCSFFLPT
jgi:hypothetical protein